MTRNTISRSYLRSLPLALEQAGEFARSWQMCASINSRPERLSGPSINECFRQSNEKFCSEIIISIRIPLQQVDAIWFSRGNRTSFWTLTFHRL
jgi:hypothetical protein